MKTDKSERAIFVGDEEVVKSHYKTNGLLCYK